MTPKPDKVDVFVTKSKLDKNLSFEDLADLPDMDELSHMSPDEFLKTLEKSILEKSKEDIEAVQSLETAEAEEREHLSQEAADEQSAENAERYIYYILRFALLLPQLKIGRVMEGANDQMPVPLLKRPLNSPDAVPTEPVRLMVGKKAARAAPMLALACLSECSAARMLGRFSRTLELKPAGRRVILNCLLKGSTAGRSSGRGWLIRVAKALRACSRFLTAFA